MAEGHRKNAEGMPSEASRRGSGGTSVPSVDRRAIVRKVVRKRSCLTSEGGSGMGAGEIARFGHDLAILDNRIEIINYMLGYGIKNAKDNPMMMCISKGEYRIMIGECEMDRFRIYDYYGAEDALKRLDGLNDGLWYMMGKWLRKINTS